MGFNELKQFNFLFLVANTSICSL